MSGPLRPVTPVGLIAEHLDRAWTRAAEVGGIDPELLADLRSARALAGGFEPYVEHSTSAESEALSALAERTRGRDWARRSGSGAVTALEPEMLSGHVEGVLLRFLVKLTRARSVLEVGMFTGYSALALAEALPADGRVIACELDPDAAAFAAEGLAASPAAERIEIRVGDARRTLEDLSLEGERFDLVFIDADKAGYVDDLAAVLDGGLLAPDGLVCVDNTLMQGEPWRPEEPSANGTAIAAFNAAVAGDPRLEQVLLPVRDGLTLIRRAG